MARSTDRSGKDIKNPITQALFRELHFWLQGVDHFATCRTRACALLHPQVGWTATYREQVRAYYERNAHAHTCTIRKHAHAHAHIHTYTSRDSHINVRTRKPVPTQRRTHTLAQTSFGNLVHSIAPSFATCHQGHGPSRTPNVTCSVAPSGSLT